MQAAHAVLIKWRPPTPAPTRIVAAIGEVARGLALPVDAVTIDLGLDAVELYAYLRLREATPVPATLARAIARAAGVAAAEVARLVRLQDIRGASYGNPVAFQYVVETDVVPGAEGDLNDWYNNEHLCGLASVPGTVRAQRFLNLDGAPRHHSCYELVSEEIRVSAPWVAVRNTAWSDRIRPAFHNTKRTMFRRIAEQPL